MSKEELKEILDRHAKELGEHFDAVQILVSWENDRKATETLWSGYGNWWARIGMCRAFLKMEDNSDSAYRISQAMKEEE